MYVSYIRSRIHQGPLHMWTLFRNTCVSGAHHLLADDVQLKIITTNSRFDQCLWMSL